MEFDWDFWDKFGYWIYWAYGHDTLDVFYLRVDHRISRSSSYYFYDCLYEYITKHYIVIPVLLVDSRKVQVRENCWCPIAPILSCEPCRS